MTVAVPAFPTPVPTRDDPVNFPPRADDVMRQFPGIVMAMNDQNAENNALNANVNLKHGEAVAAAAAASADAGTATAAAGTATAKAVEASGDAVAAAAAKVAAELARDEAMGAAPWPAGTRMLFIQSSAPVGWTKVTTHDNAALRIVSGSVGSGGSVDFSTAFASKAVSGSIGSTVAGGTVGNTTLSTSQMPWHRHDFEYWDTDQNTASGTGAWRLSKNGKVSPTTGGAGGGGAHNHPFTGAAHGHTFTGTAINLAVKYVDAIIAEKD